MNTIPDGILRLYLADLLDPVDRTELEDQLAADPALRQHLAGLRQPPRAESPVQQTRPAWMLPTPGYRPPHRQRMQVHRRMATLSDREVVPRGGRFLFELSTEWAQDNRRMVVMVQHAGQVEVVSPAGPVDPMRRVSELEQVEGRPGVSLMVGGDPGLERWAVVLVDDDFAVDWSVDEETRWAALRDAITEGTVPVGTMDVMVAE